VKPRIAILHYTAPPIVGGVENVIAAHARLLEEAGYPITLIVGRSPIDGVFADGELVVIPELDSRHPRNLEIARELERGRVPPAFEEVQRSIETSLANTLGNSDIVIVHNAFNYHFNMPLTAALHGILGRRRVRHLVAWCHDISRYVNPASGAEQRSGFPWDLLRTFRPEVSYAAVSRRRQRTLAGILGCRPELIRLVPNGVDQNVLLGLTDFGAHLAAEFQLLDADLIMLMPVRITLAKNMEFALRVTAVLRDAGIRVKLVITGPPDPHSTEIQNHFSKLLALRRELDLGDQVVFVYEGTSRLTRPLLLGAVMVAELYRLCDLVFMPSLREGFGLPVLEGGLAGRPVFCTDVPVLEEVGEESVHLIGRNDTPGQIGARILAWMEEDRSYRFRKRVRQEYTWLAIMRRAVEPLLADCMREAPLPL
jgi:glycosyltransferase involved in cell wall biosynthesis